MTSWEQPQENTNTLPLATPLHRFGSALLESVLAFVTLGIGWFVWWLFLLGKGLTPARQILGLRIIDAKTRVPVSSGQVVVRGFLVYFLAFSLLSWALNIFTFGVGFIFTIVSTLLILRESRQTLWDQVTGTTVGFQKK